MLRHENVSGSGDESELPFKTNKGKTMKRRTIITSVLVIVLCLGLISGSTFALFTSTSSVNIAVTSGKVNVVATIDPTSLKVYSATTDPVNSAGEAGTLDGTFAGTYYYKAMPVVNNTIGTFANGGTATLTNTKTLEIDRITPGDKVKVTVNVENNSNVKTKYRIRVNVLDGETLEDQAKSLKLFEGLTVNVGTNDAETRTATKLNGVIRVSDWYDLAAKGDSDNLADIPVEIFLPLKAGNEYQDLKTEIQITVEAVQNNAATNSELKLINAYLAQQEPTTMNAAIKSLVGTQIAGLTTLADYATAFAKVESYLWNVDTNQFYAESDATDFAYKYFKVYSAMPQAQTYSIYAGSAWTATEVAGLIVGFDAGETTGITSVTYNRSTAEYGQDVIIRTNDVGATLTVNAPKDVVKHYGLAGLIDIIAAANSSYHEFGTVGFVKIAKGRLAIEENSKVSQVHIKTSELTNEQTSQVVTKFDEIIVSIATPEVKPVFSRDDVEIESQGTLVVALQSGTEDVTEETELDYVWLTKQGIFEQIKVSESDTEITETAQWADELSAGTTKSASFEIANNINRDIYDNIDVKISVTESETTKTYQVALDTNRDLIVVEENADPTNAPIATLTEAGEVTIATTQFKVELANNTTDNSTELKVTNKATQEVVETAKAVEKSGLSEEQQQTAINESNFNNGAIKNIIKRVSYSSLKKALEESSNFDIIEVVDNYVTSEEIVLNSDRVTLRINENKTLEFIESGHIRMQWKSGNANIILFIEGSGTIINSTDNIIIRSSFNINNRRDEIIDINDIHFIGKYFSDCKLNVFSGYFKTEFYDSEWTGNYSPYVCYNQNSYFYGGYFTEESLNSFQNHRSVIAGNDEYPYFISPDSYQDVIEIIYKDTNRGSITPKYIKSPINQDYLLRRYTDLPSNSNYAGINLDCTIKFLHDYNGNSFAISSGTNQAERNIDLNGFTYTFSGTSAFSVGSGKTIKISNGKVMTTNSSDVKLFSSDGNNVEFDNVEFDKKMIDDVLKYVDEDDYIIMGEDTFTIVTSEPTNYGAKIERGSKNLYFLGESAIDVAITSIKNKDVVIFKGDASEKNITMTPGQKLTINVLNENYYPNVSYTGSNGTLSYNASIDGLTKEYKVAINAQVVVYDKNGEMVEFGDLQALLDKYKNRISTMGTGGQQIPYTFQLEQDIELTSPILVRNSQITNGNAKNHYLTVGYYTGTTLDLNGHNITGECTLFEFAIGSSSEFIITDSSNNPGSLTCTSSNGYCLLMHSCGTTSPNQAMSNAHNGKVYLKNITVQNTADNGVAIKYYDSGYTPAQSYASYNTVYIYTKVLGKGNSLAYSSQYNNWYVSVSSVYCFAQSGAILTENYSGRVSTIAQQADEMIEIDGFGNCKVFVAK